VKGGRTLEINNLDKLAKMVTDSILEKIDQLPSANQKTASSSIKKSKSILIILPENTIGFSQYHSYIRKNYSDGPSYLVFNDHFNKTHEKEIKDQYNTINFDLKNPEFLSLLNSAGTLLIVSPKVSQMKAITETNDSEDINHIILNGLMTNQNIVFLINSNATVLAKISSTITLLENMGISIINIQNNPDKVIDANILITERYVMDMKKQGLKTLLLNKRQVITPLAKDKLSEYKIKVEFIEEAKQ